MKNATTILEQALEASDLSSTTEASVEETTRVSGRSFMGNSWLFFKPHFSLQEGAISPIIEVQSTTESINLERGEVSPATHDAHVLLAVIGILSSLLLMVQAPLLCDCVSPLYRKFSMCTVIFPILIVDILHLFLENHYFSFFPLALAQVVESRKALFCTSGCTYGTAGVQIFASSCTAPNLLK